MADRTVVHVLRHGEVHNPEGVLYGRLPGYRLSDRGIEMAKRIADHLAAADIVHVVSSPLERAVQTAEPVALRHDLDISTDDRLLEAENHFQGLTFGVGDGALTRPQHWRYLWNPFRPSWGEPYIEQARRMLGAMSDAAKQAEGHEALVVSHQLPIWVTRSLVEGRRLWHDPRKRECSLASLTTFTYQDGKIAAVSYSEPAKDLLPPASAHVKPGA